MMRKLTSAMKVLFAVLIVYLTATTSVNGGGSHGLVESTCLRTPKYKLCVEVLSTDPRSRKATDITTLAIVMVDAVKATSEEAAGRIRDLQRSRPNMKDGLKKCDFEYNTVILGACINEAYDALTKGNPKFAEDGVVCTATSAEICEEAFKGASSSSSPLTSLNARVRDLSVVARAIIRNLLLRN